MKLRPALLALMCAWSFSSAAIAAPQDASTPDSFKADGLGLGVSWLSGSGLTYRHWFNRDWGVQVAGVPFLSSGTGGPTGFVNVGAQAMRTFVNAGRVSLYGLLGAGVGYTFGSTVLTSDANGNTTSASTSHTDFGVAPGVGLDYRFMDSLMLTASLGYTIGQTTDLSSAAPARQSMSLSPGGSIGFLFIW